ncbi:hypothetical protein SAMD00079811_24720 [Scytonema sp. HK-05]|uniref:hypothetical protein n=1 Tax=Scytonema sp. HK-05 TaxID=1137095 RepID=UPI000A6029B1|nr:hypothetical protein [Scytonema sp. HK-05]BAY44870.1 hypothetical protein SAMD00079811_24720 [Scytonema sp. HK-05]
MFKKILLPTVVISGTLFASFMLLLALQGSKPVKIQTESQEIFYGELKDIVSPGVGAVFSLGLGLAGALVWGLRHSLDQSSKLEKQLSNLQKVIAEKDSQIEALKLSPSNPTLSQLKWFLEENESKAQATTAAVNTIARPQVAPVVSTPVSTKTTETTISQAVTKPLVITNTEYESQPITVNQLSVQTATSTFPSAQSALGLTQRYRKQANA